MPQTRTPLRYPGGKSQLAKFIMHTIEFNNLTDSIYCEPFCGGSGVAISLLLRNQVSSIILNDLDTAIYSFWRAVLTETDRLTERINTVRVTMNTWHRQKNVFLNLRDNRDYSFELAFATFFLNRTNRSGIITGGPIGGYEQDSDYKLGCRFNKSDLIKKIKNISVHREQIQLYHLDAIDLIHEVLLRQAPNRLFIYFDPPYYVQGKKLYKDSFDDEMHGSLAEAIHELNDYHWIATYDDVKRIRELYNDLQIREYSIRYSANEKRQAKEIFFCSPATRVEDYDKVVFE